MTGKFTLEIPLPYDHNQSARVTVRTSGHVDIVAHSSTISLRLSQDEMLRLAGAFTEAAEAMIMKKGSK